MWPISPRISARPLNGIGFAAPCRSRTRVAPIAIGGPKNPAPFGMIASTTISHMAMTRLATMPLMTIERMLMIHASIVTGRSTRPALGRP